MFELYFFEDHDDSSTKYYFSNIKTNYKPTIGDTIILKCDERIVNNQYERYEFNKGIEVSFIVDDVCIDLTQNDDVVHIKVYVKRK